MYTEIIHYYTSMPSLQLFISTKSILASLLAVTCRHTKLWVVAGVDHLIHTCLGPRTARQGLDKWWKWLRRHSNTWKWNIKIKQIPFKMSYTCSNTVCSLHTFPPPAGISGHKFCTSSSQSESTSGLRCIFSFCYKMVYIHAYVQYIQWYVQWSLRDQGCGP